MARNKVFVRKRDGRIEVRLSESGRNFVHDQFGRVRLVQESPENPWRSTLLSPIDPSRDADDPLRLLEREKGINSNAELALVTVHEQYLSEGEAWAWMSTLQLALRATAGEQGLVSEADVTATPAEDLVAVHSLQMLLFELADVLS